MVAGTRPEVIKLAPLVIALKNLGLEHEFWTIRQHSTLLDQALEDFALVPDIDISLARSEGSLSELIAEISLKISTHMSSLKPLTTFVVQGDTTTSFMTAFLAKMYNFRVVHIEAGLRSFDDQNPFPEEINRKLITQIADLHFAPSEGAVENLIGSGVPASKIQLVGNTVVDALFYQIQKMDLADKQSNPRQILVTSHRRENWENGISEISLGLKRIIQEYADVQIYVISHPNPRLLSKWKQEFEGVQQVKILHSISYSETVLAIYQSQIILTDSGGIQEEATTLKRATGVLRKTTERPEILFYPENSLIGTDPDKIFEFCSAFFDHQQDHPLATFEPRYIFGDGTSGARIAKCLAIML